VTSQGHNRFSETAAPTLSNSQSCIWQANGAGTIDSVSYDRGDVLLTTKNESGTQVTVKLADN